MSAELQQASKVGFPHLMKEPKSQTFQICPLFDFASDEPKATLQIFLVRMFWLMRCLVVNVNIRSFNVRQAF